MITDPLAAARFLIVDDEAANIAVMEGMLEQWGCTNVLSTTDAREVFALYTEYRPDIILLDLMMPHLDGFAVMEGLRPLLTAEGYLPILVLTADTSLAARRRALAAGATDFLTKPFDAIELSLRVRTLVQTRFLHQQLEERNRELETRVQQRTAEARQSEARAQAQFQGLPVPTYTWQRREEDDDWVLVDYNHAAAQITEGAIQRLVGTTARALYGDMPEIWTTFRRCWSERTTIEQAMPYRFQSTGVEKDLLISYVYVPPDLLVVHTIDVTERARAEAAVARHVEQLSALRAIDAAIMNSLDLQLTLNILLTHATAQLGVDAAQVLILNPHMQTLESAAVRGFRGTSASRLHLRLGQGHAGRAVLERRLMVVPDLAQEEVTRVLLVAEEKFVAYAAAPLVAKGQAYGVLEVFHRAPLAQEPEWQNFLNTLAGQAAIAIDNAQLYQGLQRSNLDLRLAYDSTIEGWSRALDLRDKETEGHSQRVTEMTLRLARALGMSEEELIHVRRGALLHDIGKMGVPDAILLKPGALTEEEWTIMRRHPTFAYELLVSTVYLRPALDIPYRHHEKWDGTGYPQGLRAEQIPLAARVFAVVDVWDALSSDRPYRAAWPPERVHAHLASLAGSHFDPAVVPAFLALLEEGTHAAH